MGFWKDKVWSKLSTTNNKQNDNQNSYQNNHSQNGYQVNPEQNQNFPQQPNLNNYYSPEPQQYPGQSSNPQQFNNYPEQAYINPNNSFTNYSMPYGNEMNYNNSQYQDQYTKQMSLQHNPQQYAHQQYFDYQNLPLQHFNLPKELAAEVRSEKYRLILTMILSFIIVLSSLLPLILWFLKNNNLVIDTYEYLPHPVIMSPIFILSIGFFFVAIFDFIKIKREVDTYLRRFHFGSTIIPNFIISNYKKMHVRTIILNWIAFPTYIFGTIIVAILYGLSKTNNPIIFGFIQLKIIIKDLSTEIIILTSVLFSIFFLQILNIIFIRKRKANIIGFYGYEIVNPHELELLKKKINRRCFLIFLAFIVVLTFVIAVPILLLRRKTKKISA